MAGWGGRSGWFLDFMPVLRWTVDMYDLLCSWENLREAHRKAARGKRGKSPAAAFEVRLADNLLALQSELARLTYHPDESEERQ